MFRLRCSLYNSQKKKGKSINWISRSDPAHSRNRAQFMCTKLFGPQITYSDLSLKNKCKYVGFLRNNLYLAQIFQFCLVCIWFIRVQWLPTRIHYTHHTIVQFHWASIARKMRESMLATTTIVIVVRFLVFFFIFIFSSGPRWNKVNFELCVGRRVQAWAMQINAIDSVCVRRKFHSQFEIDFCFIYICFSVQRSWFVLRGAHASGAEVKWNEFLVHLNCNKITHLKDIFICKNI